MMVGKRNNHVETISGFFMLLFAFLVVGCTGCGRKPLNGAVELRDGQFMVREKPFYPMALNYILGIHVHGDSIWAGPSKDYARVDPNEVPSRSVMHKSFRADMELIHEAGFNTVRLVGIGELLRDRKGYFMKAFTIQDLDTIIEVLPDDERFLNELDTVMRIVREAGLRTIFLTTVHADVPETEDLFVSIAERITEDSALMAFDMFNEPLYFDKPERPKPEAIAIAAHWRDLVREHAPYQFYTVGLTGIRETFEFDPNLLGVDFISFHPYEYESDQVRNELTWYHRNVDVPWIIGETAIPADNDSVPYEAQRIFAEKVLQQSRACGSEGFSWWQYKDVVWNEFHPSFMGVLNREGETRTTRGLSVKGTPKPVMRVLAEFDPNADPGPCICLPNYPNYSEGTVSAISGRLVDEHGEPINEGVVIGWNEHWSGSYHTTSGPDGRFQLRGTFYFHHWMASATYHKMDRGDAFPISMNRGADGIPAYELGDIVLARLNIEVPN
ncbi:MAG: cellulase family glycosylhydrolase [Flavobacteriales bacterium]